MKIFSELLLKTMLTKLTEPFCFAIKT
jgi:hypothetical protein